MFIASTKLSCVNLYQESFKTVSSEQLLCFLESFLLFRVYCFKEFEVFWPSTVPLTAHKHSTTSPCDIIWDVGKPNVGFGIKQPGYDPPMSYILGVKTLYS